MSGAANLTGATLDGRYWITGLLGEGGMGQVYAAIQVALERKVAVKILHPRLAYDSRARERFLREAKAASSIQHPNVVQIMDFGDTPDGSAYFVMEHLEGRDLRDALREDGKLPWPRAREILLQATRALAAAHKRSIVHRDVKPANCFLLQTDPRCRADVVKLLDFGIAKVETDADGGKAGQRLTATGEVFGTATYMAPEQARGEPLDARSDIYSLGIMAYEMLAGRVPFTGANAIHVITQHLNVPPRPLRAIDPSFSTAVEALVLRAIAKETKDRFASMAELEAALLAIPPVAGAQPQRKTIPFVPPRPTLPAAPVLPMAPMTAAHGTGGGDTSAPEPKTSTAPDSAIRGTSALSLPASVVQQSPLRASIAGELMTTACVAAGRIAPDELAGSRPDLRAPAASPTAAVMNAPGTDGSTPPPGDAAATAAIPGPAQPARPSTPHRGASAKLGVAALLAGIGMASAIGTMAWTASGEAPSTVSGASQEPAPADARTDGMPLPPPTTIEAPANDPELLLDHGEHPRAAESPGAAQPIARAESGVQTVDGKGIGLEPITPADPAPTTGKAKHARHLTSECNDRRSRAEHAMKARKWKEVLSATKLRSCWPKREQDERRSLMIMAYVQTGDFSRCVETGRGIEDARAKTFVKICEKQLAAQAE